MFASADAAKSEKSQAEPVSQKADKKDLVAKNDSSGDETASDTLNPQSGLPEMSVIDEMKRHHEELEAKEKELATREAELHARERALNEEMKKISAIRDDLGKIDTARKSENDEKVVKLVDTFQTMSPKAASILISTLDDSLAVAAIAKMDTLKLAKIMNSMEPSRSAKLSELLAGVVRAKSTLAPPVREPAQTSPTNTNDVSGTANPKGGNKK